MAAAEDCPVGFHAMTYDTAPAVRAMWCQGVNGAFKAIESVGLARHNHIKGFVVIVSAFLASCHKCLLVFG